MEGIEALMRHIYVFPLVGAVLGIILGAVALALTEIAPPGIAAALILVVIVKICGINHADGLADFGDGVTAHTTVEKKISAMKDVHIGTGGVVFLVVTILAVYSSLVAIPKESLPVALVVAEVAAKQSMIAFAAFSVPLQKGFGSIAIENASRSDFLVGLLISALICWSLSGPAGVAVLLAAQISALYMVAVSKRNFGGATGDGFGATNEVARAVALIVAALLIARGLLWEVSIWTPW
ncbi:MAG: Adenosylcobinamide-GDP ribazoletransferase [Methanothrix sp.]|jgi:adenosylcobinamide-GDP ribazoletransferase|nr:MAG: Adenosylcobinamide-GDP ribazoletransferase [Methanothrix sp.]